ncbi:hypothetical protein [Granulicella rosea]|uniref:hypothetical protein n=1 Tax=Granulicella rosea TaxID=474952 RepID=UPI000B77578A|nr:hypothetical protein [Granulicella rosea]
MILLIVSVGMYGVGCRSAELRPSHYPAGVPAKAIWAGGADGGAYIYCSIDDVHDANDCTVWNDSTGEIVEQGKYRLVRHNRGAKAAELDYSFADFGGTIGLKNNLVLKRTTLP